MSVTRWEPTDLIGASDEDFDQLYFDAAEFAARRSLEDAHYWHLYRRTVLLQVLRDLCPDRGRRLIELGCGAGTVATYLNEHGYHVDYADVHREGLQHAYERARERLGAAADARRFVRLDLTRQVPPDPYDGFLILDVLEHLPDDVGVLRRIRQAYRAEGDPGFLVFTVPAFQMLWSPWDDVERHKRRYTVAQAKRLARDGGFEVTRATYFFFPLFFAALGVKGLRTLRNALRPPSRQARFDTLTEARSHPWLNRVMQAGLAPERGWLRRWNLPLGTSVLVVARPV